MFIQREAGQMRRVTMALITLRVLQYFQSVSLFAEGSNNFSSLFFTKPKTESETDELSAELWIL